MEPKGHPELAEAEDRRGADVTHRERSALVDALAADPAFRRDTGLAALLRPGRVSYRQVVATDSLHVLIKGNHVTAHVDGISPFLCRPDGRARLSLGRILAHNLSCLKAELLRRAQGRDGEQRCHLECETIWVDDCADDCGDDCADDREAGGVAVPVAQAS